MNRLRILFAIIGCAVALVLAGCSGFTPVYGGLTSATPAGYSFQFAKPRNRLEQIILNELAAAFPAPATGASPTLSVNAAAAATTAPMSSAITLGRIVGSRVTATVTIAGTVSAFSVTRFADAGYQPGAVVVTDQAALTNAQETAARATAESLRAAILATYRPTVN